MDTIVISNNNTSTTDLYESSKGIIYERALSFSRKTGVSKEDLLSFGHSVFMKALKAWSPDKQKKMKFTTFLHWRLSMQFITYTKAWNTIEIRDADSLPEEAIKCSQLSSFEFLDYMNNTLDSDAKEVLSVVLSSFKEVLPINQAAVVKQLRSKGWCTYKISKAFDSIKSCLRDW